MPAYYPAGTLKCPACGKLHPVEVEVFMELVNGELKTYYRVIVTGHKEAIK